MDGEGDLLDGELVFTGDGELVDHLGRVCADNVGAEYLTVFGVANDFDEAFCLARGAGAAASHEREFADLVVDLLFPDLRFGHPDRRDFRMAVCRTRDVAVVHRMHVLLTREILREDDAFAHSLVGKHWWTSDVADCVDAFDGGLHSFVDLDEAALGHLDAGFLDSDVFNVWRATGGDKDFFDLEWLFLPADLDIHGDGALAHLHIADLRARKDIDLPLLEAAGELGAAVGVLEGEDTWQNFEQRHLGAKGSEHVGELATNRAGTNDRHRLRR